MSYQHHDQGGSYGGSGGILQYPSSDQGYYQQQHQRAARQMLPSQERRGMSPSSQHAPPGARGPPPVRPLRPGERQQHREQQYAPPMPPPPPPVGQEYQENLYDGSAYGELEYGESMAADAWPLPSPPQNSGHLEHGRSSSEKQRRGPPPRPQRPDYQPHVDPRQPRVAPAQEQYRQPHPQQHYPPSHHGSGQWTGDGYASPSNLQALPQHYPQSSQQFLPANKRPPLGPPPSARRGPASYYPQVAPVHPIVEETDSMRGSVRSAAHTMGGGGGHDSMRSYASSNAIPIGIPDYYLHQHSNAGSVPSLPGAERHAEIFTPNEEFDESPIDREMSPVIERGGSAMEEGDSREPSPEPQPALVRQASMGRKSKPTLTTVKSGDRMRQASLGDGRAALPSQQKKVEPVPDVRALVKEAGFAKETLGSISPRSSYSDDEPPRSELHNPRLREKEMEAGGVAAVAAMPKPVYIPNRASKSKDDLSNRSDPLASGTGLLDPTPSASDSDEKSFRAKIRKQDMDDMPTRSQILAELSKGGALPATEAQAVPGAGLAESRAGRKRPPRLNVDAVRDAEARGSLTSLPDLIKRATRLASNLDRGKTASRLGMNWFEGANDDERRASAIGKRASEGGSLSDMLNSFPRPENGTPEPGSDVARGGNGSRWARSQLTSSSSSGRDAPRSRRRCCGMPLWLFLLILTLLILLVAAAIIVPVVLVVVPRQNSASADAGQTMTAAALNQCRSTLPCANSGASVLTSGGDCGCICVNGYTGTQCGTASQAGCASVDVGETRNATVGDQLPGLLQSAEADWGVPLDTSVLLGVFSKENLGCSGENGLVDLNGTSSKSRRRRRVPTPTSLPLLVGKRQDTPNAATTNGIVFETGNPTTTSTSSVAAIATSSASPSASSSASSSNSELEKQQTFAQITILFVLQATGQLGNAVSAQTELSNFFADESASSNTTVSLGQGSGWWCDLTGFRVMEGNGTVVGGKGGA